MDNKLVAAAIGAAALVGVGVGALGSGGEATPVEVRTTEVKISDPAAREAFLKIENPTPLQIRMAEDSH